MKLFRIVKKIILFFFPPPNWRFMALIVSGISLGLIIYILYISNAYSYLSDDPKTCVNCHVMAPQYATWSKSSHGNVTNCNDCHVPHTNIFSKYYFKASDGLRHSYMFTFRLEPQVIKIKEAGVSVVQQNCIRCHRDFVETVNVGRLTASESSHGGGMLCWECHREVPHGRVHSLASTPYAQIPRLDPVIPEWITKYLSKKENIK